MSKAVLSILRAETLAGGGKEGIDASLLERMRRVEEFALDRPIVASATFAGDEIDANVGIPAVRPFRPKPDIGKTIRVLRIG